MVEMGSQWCHWVAHGTPNVPKWNQKSIPKPDYRDSRVLAWSNGTNEQAKAPQKPPKQSQHDDWWNSLTDEQKQQLYNDQEELFKLTIEEMNDERE